MTALGDSFRLADLSGSVLSPQRSIRQSARPASVGGNPRATNRLSPPEAVRGFLPAWRSVARILQRPRTASRTAVETRREEFLNTATHAVGFALSLAGFAYLLCQTAASGGMCRAAICAIFATTMVALYGASMSYHATTCPERKQRLRLCDHVAIYLLIAGTYTPLLAWLLPARVGLTLLLCVWSLAGIGIVIKVQHADRLEETSPLPCLGLGWLALFAVRPLSVVMPGEGMLLLILGGVSYTIGLLFYCRDDQRYFHAIWHVFVITGTALHFATVVICVVW